MPRQIGWSQESNLLYNISMQLDRLAAVTAAAGGGGTITGSGAAGQVTYWTGASAVSGSNNLFWNNTTNRLGINTPTPTSALQVVGTIRATIISTPLLTSEGSNDLQLGTQGGTTGFTIKATTRNLLLYSGVLPGDSGQRLQVYGNAIISSSDASGTYFEVKRTSLTDRYFRVLSTGNIEASSISTGDPNYQFITGANNNSTTGDRRFFWLQNNFSPTSGTATYRTLELTTVINQTGGANGITRGLNINPTLTAASDWRSIEWSNNTGWGLYGQGTADNFLGGGLLINGVLRETITTNRQTASYTLALADRGKLVETNVGAANTITVPLNSSIAFPIGTKIDIAQYGAGQTSIVPGVGVTVRSALGALKLAAQYSGASLVKIGTDEWYLFGDITV